jgi:ketosteroid isomerase-like protein
MLSVLASLLETAPDSTNRIDDVLALQSDAFLVRVTNFGTSTIGGGAYERPFLILWTFGADGLLTRSEQFDVGREAEALARFDEIGAEAAPERRPARRVRPNAATEHARRQLAVIEAGDASALLALASDDLKVVHHPSHSVYGREEWVGALRSFIRARDGKLAIEPLATLGDSLALCLSSFSASGTRGRKFDVGPIEYQDIALLDVDDRGRCAHCEIFAPDRLSDAIARLYERYAELLPEGPERARVAAIARWAATATEDPDVERIATMLAPDVEFLDRRSLGLGSARGRPAVVQSLRALVELSERFEMRADDVLGLRVDALLVRWANLGTLRDGGGAYERRFLLLMVFAPDGLVTRSEWFDPDREAEALTRFDALAAAPAAARPRRRVRSNAATEFFARGEALVASRDLDAIAASWADDIRFVHGPAGTVFGLEEMRAWFRLHLEDPDAVLESETIATLGEWLALQRATWSGSRRRLRARLLPDDPDRCRGPAPGG